MSNNIMVKIEKSSNDFYVMKTYDRQHKRCQNFYISMPRFDRWIATDEDNPSTFFDVDIHDHLEVHMNYVRRNGKIIRDGVFSFKLTHLSSSDGVAVNGYIQRFEIPENKLMALVYLDMPLVHLHHNERKSPKMDFSNAATTLRNIQNSPAILAAFKKGIRDSFKWDDDKITFYNDGGCDFYFMSEGRFPLNGGFVLHTATDRQHNTVKSYFGVHT